MAINHQDTEDCDSDASVDTNQAFMEMLGFSGLDICEETFLNAPEENLVASCTVIPLPSNCSKYHLEPSDCLAVSIDNIGSLEDCRTLIDLSHNRFQYITEAAHVTPEGETFMVQIQNPNPHKLSIIDTSHDPYGPISNSIDVQTLILDRLYQRIKSILEGHPRYAKFKKRKHCGPMRGLNPRMRLLKYDACDKDRFEPHFDATTMVRCANQTHKRSLITVLLYLNDGDGVDFDGGETVYMSHCVSGTQKANNLDNVVKVIPKAGRICLFEHDLFHSGAPLTWGTKYIMRTDVLFDDGDYNEVEHLTSEHFHSNNKNILVADLCDELAMNDFNIQILKDLDLLSISCESILSPGITVLKKMLTDCGMDADTVQNFTVRAFEAAKV